MHSSHINSNTLYLSPSLTQSLSMSMAMEVKVEEDKGKNDNGNSVGDDDINKQISNIKQTENC